MKLRELLDRFQGMRALVVGDLMLDEYVFGKAARISPEAPVMVIRQTSSDRLPGGAANVALNLRAVFDELRTVALLIAVILTAFYVPNMLRKGSIDLLISKPIGRTPLLIYKYIGGLTFIFLVSAFTVGGVWLVLALRTGYWDPTFLILIPAHSIDVLNRPI